MGRLYLASISPKKRSIRHLRWRLILTLFITAIFYQQHLFAVHRQSLVAKYSPTVFHTDDEQLWVELSTSNIEDAQFQTKLMADRDAWKILGEGCEGKVFLYKDSVIKTFTPGRSPFRNVRYTSNLQEERWPTEIPASLLLGGFILRNNSGGMESNHLINNKIEGLLPVQTYFKASASPQNDPEWHLVTPLAPGGTLKTLAHRTALNEKFQSFRDVDARFRPAFETLLNSIQNLHDAGYCHDDIKPGNIFVDDDTKWLLGDLGNVRNIEHPYHSSRLWIKNHQLRDCRANDVMRALKSYMKFIQRSTYDQHSFNEAFFTANEPLSRLFWKASAIAPIISATQLREFSSIEDPQRAYTQAMVDSLQHKGASSILGIVSTKLALWSAVNDAIKISLSDISARWWAMTWIFGVPTE